MLATIDNKNNSAMDEQEFVEYNTRLFKRVAPMYKWLDLIASRCRGKFCTFLGPMEGKMVLDVATGTGMQALAFSRKGAKVTGVDLSEDMLLYARKNDPENKVEFIHANGTGLPFDKNTFDITAMSFALHCMTEEVRFATLTDMKRVTKENGRIAFIDYNRPQRGIGRGIYKIMSKLETPLYRKFLASDFQASLNQAGLRIVERKEFFFGVMQMIVCRKNDHVE